MTVVTNEDNELVPTRLVTGWHVCIDYRKLNEATRKDHFPLPFMDQMLERLAGNEYYCFLDGFFGYLQIPIDPQDQEKTTFTCRYGTFAYRRMPFGLCHAPGTFQRCMMAIFHDMIEETMEVFMDDFLVFGDSFSSCLSHLDKMFKRCEDTNLVLNWEKCHFMVKEGIVFGHKISKSRIEKLVHRSLIRDSLAFLQNGKIVSFEMAGPGPEFTWEREDQFRKKYPHLFTKTAPSSISSMSDSEDSTYTEISSPYEDLSDIGSPGAEGPIFQDPPSPDYVPGLEEPEQAPPSPIYVPFVPEPVYPEFLPKDDVLPAKEQLLPVAASPTTESPRYIPESSPEEDPEEDDEEDPEEDPADYPADRDDEEPSDDDDDDDDDAEEEEHLAPANPAAVAYSADQDPYLAYRVTARMSIQPQAPAPFLSEEVAVLRVLLVSLTYSTTITALSIIYHPLPQIPSSATYLYHHPQSQ
ncbi:reverse transcriptase domain-containing protein [Tanacetum coccineum]